MRVQGIPYVQGRNAYTDVDGRKYGIAIHNTSNNATAENEALYATRRTDGTSSHFYVDNDSIIQSLDTNSRAGHAGSQQGNNNAIAFEITGTNDKSRQWWLDNVAWVPLGHVLALLCVSYDITVRRASVTEMKANQFVQAFYSHNDMRLAWGGTDHTDPGPNFPWDRLFQVTNAALMGEDMEQTEKLIGNQAYPNRAVGDALADVENLTDTLMWANPQYARRQPEAGSMLDKLGKMVTSYPLLLAQLTALAGKDFVDEAAIVAGVLAGLDPEAIAAAIPDTIAKDVADLLAARLAA